MRNLKTKAVNYINSNVGSTNIIGSDTGYLSVSSLSNLIFLGIGLSGFINVVLANLFFNPKDEIIHNDAIFNISSAIEFIIVGISLNFTYNNNNSENSLNDKYYNHFRIFLSRFCFGITLIYIFIVIRVNYEPLDIMIKETFSARNVSSLSSATSSFRTIQESMTTLYLTQQFQIPLLKVIYFIHLILYLLLYSKFSAYRFLALIISNIFIEMSSLESFSLNDRLFESYAFEKLILRRWIKTSTVLFMFFGIIIDIYQDLSKLNFYAINQHSRELELTNDNSQLKQQVSRMKLKKRVCEQQYQTSIQQFKKSLQSASTIISLLHDTDVQPNQIAYLQKFSKSFEHLNLLAKECLFYSEVKSLKKIDLENFYFKLENILEESISYPAIRANFEEKDIDLFYLVNSDVPANIIADGQKIKNIILRLLSNAVKSTYQGEVYIIVSTSTNTNSKGEVFLNFSVVDTGSGIDSEFFDHLFEPFQSNHSLEGELGLGLPICHELAKLLGGMITFSSELSIGSTFVLTVPVQVTPSQPSFFNRNVIPTKWGKGLKVLVVDDNPHIASVFEMHLEPLGFQVYSSTTVASAIAMIKEQPDQFSLIFIDTTIPYLNIEEIKQIRLFKSLTSNSTSSIGFNSGGGSNKTAVSNMVLSPLVLMCTGKFRKQYNYKGVNFLYKPIKKEQLLSITHSYTSTLSGTTNSTTQNIITTSSVTPSLNSSSVSLQSTPLLVGNSANQINLQQQSQTPTLAPTSISSPQIQSTIPTKSISTPSTPLQRMQKPDFKKHSSFTLSPNALLFAKDHHERHRTISNVLNKNSVGNNSSTNLSNLIGGGSGSPSSSSTNNICNAVQEDNLSNQSFDSNQDNYSPTTTTIDDEQQKQLKKISNSNLLTDQDSPNNITPTNLTPTSSSPLSLSTSEFANKNLDDSSKQQQQQLHSDQQFIIDQTSPLMNQNTDVQQLKSTTSTPQTRFVRQPSSSTILKSSPSLSPPKLNSSNSALINQPPPSSQTQSNISMNTSSNNNAGSNSNISGIKDHVEKPSGLQNILLVEDNPVNAKIATTVLQKHNFKVELTSNGQLAMDKIKTSHAQFHLILMDIHMPVMDGIQCSKLVRKFESEHGLKNIPIIALTADTSAGHKNTCLEAGCNEFMAKPLDYPSLISMLKKLINN